MPRPSRNGAQRVASATKLQAVARGKEARNATRMQQIESVYGANVKEAKPPTEVERLRARITALEKENRMLKLRLSPLPQEAASAAGGAAKRSSAKSRAQKGSGEALWSLESWLRTIPMPKIVSNALLKHLRQGTDGEAAASGLEQAFMDELGTSSDLETFMALLKDALVLEEIADHLFTSARRLAQQKAAARKRALRLSQQQASGAAEDDEDARVAAFRAKFVDEGAIELVMGDLAAFFQQLHGLVGVPGALSVHAMRSEHTARSDATIEFTASNYGTATTSTQEYAFVVDGALAPKETRNVTEARRRQPRTLASFAGPRADHDAKLAKQGIAALGDAEFIAARLYTGPVRVIGPNTARSTARSTARALPAYARICLPGGNHGIPLPPPAPLGLSSLCFADVRQVQHRPACPAGQLGIHVAAV